MVRWHEDGAQLSGQRRAFAVGGAQGSVGRGGATGGVEGNPTKGIGEGGQQEEEKGNRGGRDS